MQSSDSDSDESMATSVPKQPYKCGLCSKRFRSGQALGGHQNVHRLVPRVTSRSLQRHLQAIRARAVFNNRYSFPGELIEGHGDHQPPEFGNGSDHHHQHLHDQEVAGVDARLPNLEPKLHDFLGNWLPQVDKPREEVASSSERTISSPIFKVSRRGEAAGGGGDDDDQEVTSKKNEELDLELKLGF